MARTRSLSFSIPSSNTLEYPIQEQDDSTGAALMMEQLSQGHNANSTAESSFVPKQRKHKRHRSQSFPNISHPHVKQPQELVSSSFPSNESDSSVNGDGRHHVPAKFISNTYAMLCDHRFTHLIHWDSEGKSFSVLDEDRLASEVLPVFFKHSNIASFVRQLHTYGFRKLPKVAKSKVSAFEHDKFIRGRPDLLNEITRRASDAITRQKGQIQTLQGQIDELRRQNAQLAEEHSRLAHMFRQLAAVISFNFATGKEAKDLLDQFRTYQLREYETFQFTEGGNHDEHLEINFDPTVQFEGGYPNTNMYENFVEYSRADHDGNGYYQQYSKECYPSEDCAETPAHFEDQDFVEGVETYVEDVRMEPNEDAADEFMLPSADEDIVERQVSQQESCTNYSNNMYWGDPLHTH